MQLNLHNLFKITLLFYTVLGMHVTTFTPGGSGLFPTSNMIGWAVVSLLTCLGLLHLCKTRNIVISKLHMFIAVGLLLIVLPIFFPLSALDLFLPRLLGLLGGCLLLFSMYQLQMNRQQRYEILFILLIGIFIESIIGLTQFYIFNFIDLNVFGYELLNERPSGVFRQPNLMASFMATGVILSLILVYADKKDIYKSPAIIINYLCLLFASIILVLLQSKAGYLGAILAVMLCLPLIYMNASSYKKAMLTIIIGLIIGSASMAFMQKLDRGDSLYSDNGVRTDIISVSAKMFIEKPVLGYGYGKFERNYFESHLEQMKHDQSLKLPSKNLSHPHNEFLLWGLEGGILALLGIFSFCIGFLYIFRGDVSVLKLSFLALILPITLHTQTEWPFYMSFTHYLYFMIIIWFVDSELSSFINKPIANINLIKSAAIILPIIVVPFMISAIHTSVQIAKFHESKFRNIDHLTSIVNETAWQDYIEQMVNDIKLTIALHEKNSEGLIAYVDWASKYVELFPREKKYQYMIVAIETLDSLNIATDDALKRKIYNDAAFLYPKREHWGLDTVSIIQ